MQVQYSDKNQEDKTNTLDQMNQKNNTTHQYLTFYMNKEEYGVDILCVQEIRGWENTTPLPNSPEHIKGVINLRGTIVPIIDLRRCFGLEDLEYTALTVVIVVKVKTEEGSRTVGIVVDAVSDVYTVSKEEMRAPPELGNNANADFIHGLVTVNENMVILLNIDTLLSAEELPDLSNIT